MFTSEINIYKGYYDLIKTQTDTKTHRYKDAHRLTLTHGQAHRYTHRFTNTEADTLTGTNTNVNSDCVLLKLG